MSAYTRGQALVAQLRAAGVKATTDPAAVAHLAPVVLVTPPSRQLAGGPTRTWTLAACSSNAAGSEQSWAELDALTDAAVAALDGLVEAIRPATYAHTPGADPVPAFLLTITESE